MDASLFPFKGTCLFDYKGQGMRTDVLLPKAGTIVTGSVPELPQTTLAHVLGSVLRQGEATGEKGYNDSWYFCELNNTEG
jgi:hypothetical protein